MSAAVAAAPLSRTPLYDFHVAHGAHFVPFNGWEMPLYYSGILAEHSAVRSGVGLFDVGHMGILTVEGSTAAALLSRRTTAHVERLVPGQARYTFFLELTGHIVDDLLITRLDRGTSPTRAYLVVPNAGRAQEIESILQQHRHPDVTIRRWNGAVTILAVQGPSSRRLLETVMNWSLAPLRFYTSRFYPDPSPSGAPSEGIVGGANPGDLADRILVSRTGYTGELGYELYVPGARAIPTAEALTRAGAVPCGLGARDTLRLEKGFLLSGQEFARDRSPIEAGQERFVERDHDFVGRPAIDREIAEGTAEHLVGLMVTEPGAIPRHGTPIRYDGKALGTLTSGGMSPSLHAGIALAYLPKELSSPGTLVELEIRGRWVPARVTPLPFVPAAHPPS